MPRLAPLLPVFLAVIAAAQTPVPTLKADSKIVVIDVSVTDKSGQPVHNLKASDFTLAENGTPQTISHFDAHASFTAEQAAQVEALPKLAPNIFTNYSPVPLDNTLNVILLDDLNTRQKVNSVVIQQALKYLSMPHPGTRMEIFELGPEGTLKLIQGFTSDPEILRAALVNRKVMPVYSGVDNELRRCGIVDYSVDMDGAGGVDADAGSTSSGAGSCLAIQLKVRSISTLEAMTALAKYMGNLPGRKNLLWFSSSFTMPPAQRDVLDELHSTMALFARHQVVVYPIVANGLASPPAVPSYVPGGLTVGGAAMMANPQQQLNRNDSEKATMEVMAEDTGGKVYARTNDLAGAAGKAVDDGSNYYTLTYTPLNKDWKGEFRKVQVKLAQKGYTLAYRTGYYAEDANQTQPTPAITDAARVALNAAMEYGSPQPSDVVLKVAVSPATGRPENEVAKLNVMAPRVTAPFERYVIAVAALPQAFTFKRAAPGKIHMAARLVTRVYSADGALINTTAVNAVGDVTDAAYQAIMANGLQFHQEISVPMHGDTFLRIGVEDLATSRVGVVEIPVAMVANLNPLEATTK